MTADIVSLPAFQHTETCDALTIGRRVMERVAGGIVGPVYLQVMVDQVAVYRQPCDCGRTRLNAVMDELRRVGKALDAYRDGKATHLTAAAVEVLAQQETVLRDRRDAIRAELARVS